MSTTICSVWKNIEAIAMKKWNEKQHAAWWYLFMRDRHIKMRNLHIKDEMKEEKKRNFSKKRKKRIQQCGAYNKWVHEASMVEEAMQMGSMWMY